MAPTVDVSDSTDWLQTPLKALGRVESALRCQVCKEFYQTPMITSCAHTFCSLCIRRCLATDGRCPICRAEDQSNRLRKNDAVQEIVQGFLEARPEIIELGRKVVADAAAQPKGRKRNREEMEVEQTANTRRTRSKARNEQQAPAAAAIVIDDSQSEKDDIEDEVEAAPEPDDGLCACPICGKRMKEEAVFPHLDSHNDDKPEKPKPQGMILGQKPVAPKMELLPTVNYSILTETALRRKIAQLGIPSNGNKQAISRRHTEWVNMWNANCDAVRPKTRRELLRDLDTWERSQNAPSSGSEVMGKDFDRDAWSNSHKNDFQDLIKQARERAKAKKAAEASSTSPNGTAEPNGTDGEKGASMPNGVENTSLADPGASAASDAVHLRNDVPINGN